MTRKFPVVAVFDHKALVVRRLPVVRRVVTSSPKTTLWFPMPTLGPSRSISPERARSCGARWLSEATDSGGRHDGRALAPGPARRPGPHHGGLHPDPVAAVNPTVAVVDFDDAGVARAQAQAGVSLPVVGEALHPVQLDGPVGIDEDHDARR